MGFLGVAHGWWGVGGGAKRPLLPKICHTYPTMMKLGTVILYLKKIQKIYESPDTLLEFYWRQHFFTGNQSLKIVSINMVTILMMSAKMMSAFLPSPPSWIELNIQPCFSKTPGFKNSAECFKGLAACSFVHSLTFIVTSTNLYQQIVAQVFWTKETFKIVKTLTFKKQST